jgi:hypothetical protein
MSEWISFDPSKLYPQEIDDALDTFGSVVGVLSSALDGLSDILDVLAVFSGGIDDINELIIKAAQELILSITQALTQTGVYQLFHTSPSVSYTLTPREWLAQVADSLTDRMDEKRPKFTDENAYVGAIVVMATSENLKDLFTDYYNFTQLFQRRLAEMSQIENWPVVGEEFTVEEGIGREPNWNAKRVVDIIPRLSEIAEKLIGFANSLSGPVSTSNLLSVFADMLSAKAAYLTNFVFEIQDILNAISLVLNFEGAYVLPIYGQGDADWVKEKLLSSTGGPLDDEDANYSMGVMLLATGGTTQPADTLFTLFGLPTEVTP